MHKLDKMILIPPLNTPYEPLSDKKDIETLLGFNTTEKEDKTYIDEDEIEDQSITNDRCFSIHHALQEINCHQVSFLKRENH
jgi:hypothetical protein